MRDMASKPMLRRRRQQVAADATMFVSLAIILLGSITRTAAARAGVGHKHPASAEATVTVTTRTFTLQCIIIIFKRVLV